MKEDGEGWQDGTRAVTLSSGSHPPDFPDRKKNDYRKRERRGTRKRADLQAGVAGKRRAA